MHRKVTSNSHFGLHDLGMSIRSWRVWITLAIQDIILRYRGSFLGPFWITISTAITTLVMGYLYGILFGIDRSSYLPYFCTGIIGWGFISTIIMESTKIFNDCQPYMENFQLPCVLYIFRLIFRNIIVLAHNLPVYLVVAAIFKVAPSLYALYLIPSLLLLSINALLYGTMLAMLSTRFPDVGAIIASILQVVFFVTPIMWTENALPERLHIFLLINPFYYFINLMRKPLLGLPLEFTDLFGICIVTCIGMALFFPVLRVYSRRVIFWL